MKNLFVLCWLALILSGICGIFWYNEWKYNLPTPLPVAYHTVNPGDSINLQGHISSHHGRPLFLHFFNPDCPCSRFNIPHFQALVKKYGDRMDFAVVVINRGGTMSCDKIREKYELTVPVLSDTAIAGICGVYSTPQAAIIDGRSRLYYRGNYNRSRYCTDTKSNFAQMAIDSLLSAQSRPSFNQYALKAYGCQLPYCTR